MTVVGITGHQNLPPATERLVEPLVLAELQTLPDLLGATSLAKGADQLFARCVRRSGGRLLAIIPAADYADQFSPSDRARYQELLAEASEVVQLPFPRAGEQAYWAAGQEVVRRSDQLLAIWDGQPAAGLGGTGDVVRYARDCNVPVTVIWPPSALRG